MRIAVISDVHVSGPVERARHDETIEEYGHDLHPVKRKLRRGLHRVRTRLWNAHPEWREQAFLRALRHIDEFDPDWVVANGDYGGDFGGVGVSDAATYESASGVIRALRRVFHDRCRFVFGDHDLGKYSTVLRAGGIRIKSLELGERRLGIPSFWHEEDKGFHLIGLNSSLLTLDHFLPEALKHEIPEWKRRQFQHIELIRETFAHLPVKARVILFCHDPSALHALSEIRSVRNRLAQIEMTIIGHLHAPSLLKLAKLVPAKAVGWKPKYPVARIIAHGLEGVASWKLFNPIVCPSTFGAGHHFRGGVLLIEPNAHGRLVARRRRIRK